MTSPAPTLESLQGEMQAFLLGEPSAIATRIARGRGPSPADRLAIYHRAYRARLTDALRDTYAHTARYLGSEFDDVADLFVGETPSSHGNLREYGGGFAPWLATRCPAHPELGELAALDLALRRAFDGPDGPTLAMADLAAVAPDAWESLRLRLHPAGARLRFRFNTLAIWQALDREEVPPPPEASPQPFTVIVWRIGHQPHFRSVSPPEAFALECLEAGLAFGHLCEAISVRFPETPVAREAGALLRRWAEDGVLAAP